MKHKKECTRKNRSLCECDPSSNSPAWKTETQHTPTPWTYGGDTIFDAKEKPVATMRYKDIGQDDANAAFIVRAVNYYAKVEKVISKIAYKNKEEATEYFLDAVNNFDENMRHIEDLEIMLSSLREAFYVTGTSEALRATFEKSHELMQRIKTRNSIAQAEVK